MTTVHNANKSLQELQALVGNWSDYNFGSGRTTTYRSLYGIIEEFGELVHAQLKMEQGIRGTDDEHMAKIKDAVGDLVFYMMDYLHMMNEVVDFDWPGRVAHIGEISLFDVIANILYEIDDLVQEHRIENFERTAWKAELILYRLNDFCERSGIDMRDAVWTTAEEVFQRDWIKFPKNGKTE